MINLRNLEKTDKWGFIFFISYDGGLFHSFDEMAGKKTVKGTFGENMKKLGFTWAKGIQQGGRTDAKVSAQENLLYVSSRFNGDTDKLLKDFNGITQGIRIKSIVKTLPNLAFPEMIEKREYIYSYPKKKIILDENEIKERCIKYSGTYDVSMFTDKKGQNLKEHIRTVEVELKEGKLHFSGNSFMPKQVRIMSAYILNDSFDPLPGKYLTLKKVLVKKELENMYINRNKKIEESLITNLEKAEKIGDINIFYVKNENKSSFIGKNGCEIKKLKKIYGEILVRAYDNK